MNPSITLYISPRDIQNVETGPVTGRSVRDASDPAVAHLVQVSFPLDNYEIIPSVTAGMNLFTVQRLPFQPCDRR